MQWRNNNSWYAMYISLTEVYFELSGSDCVSYLSTNIRRLGQLNQFMTHTFIQNIFKIFSSHENYPAWTFTQISVTFLNGTKL